MACVMEGVKCLVILVHAGEGKSLTEEERLALIRTYVGAVGAVPIIAGITGEGIKVAAAEAKKCKAAGATGAPVYPNHGWLRFDFQKGLHRIFTRRSGKNRPPVHRVPVPRRDEASTISIHSSRSRPSPVVATKNGETLRLCWMQSRSLFGQVTTLHRSAITRDHKVRVEGRQADHRSNPAILPIAILRHI